MTTTRAKVLRGFDRGFSFEDIRLAEPRPDELGARLTPVVVGHEGSSVVTKVGAAYCEEFNLVVDPELPLELQGPLGCGLQTGASTVLNELSGVGEIVVVDLIESRLAMAKELGATRTVRGSVGDQVTAVLVGGRDGRFPFDRLIRSYPMNEIDTAERDPLAGVTIKPVLLP
jgi:Zn-dependent alcohol dehydrogenase